MFSSDNSSLFHSHNCVLFSKSAVCLAGFMLRYTINLESLFMCIGAGVKCDFYINVQITMHWLIFSIVMTMHLKNHQGGKADCTFWSHTATVHHGREDRQNFFVLGGGLGTGSLYTWLWSRKKNTWVITFYKTPGNLQVFYRI